MQIKILRQMILVFIFLLLSSLPGQAARPIIITRTLIDLNGDGRKDSVAIEITSGRFFKANDPADESCPSCMCGAPKYVGQFIIEVKINGRKSVRQSLNRLIGGFDNLEFWAKPWKIIFDDYNGDGQIDFNVGQYTNCNGWAYWLFTIAPSGHVSQLKVEKGNPSSEIFASDDANSTRIIRHTAYGFYTKGYYNGADPVGFYT